ncbi:phosphoenolpyruvate--protein phosphotransferase [Aggregatilineales bacterium SYSU G02658]
MSKRYQGLAASPGIAVGITWVLRKQELQIERYVADNSAVQLERLEQALETAKQDLVALTKRAREHVGESEAAIFEAHQMFLEDPDILTDIQQLITETHLNAEAAVYDIAQKYMRELQETQDAYFQARASDLRDVMERVIRCLQGHTSSDTRLPGHPVIIVADDLTPSDTVQLDKTLILGLVTVKGGPTSHTAILARSLGIPAVVSVPIVLSGVESRTPIILDALDGIVILEPDDAEQEEARAKRVTWLEQQSNHLALAHEPAITLDGVRVEVAANVGSVDDVRDALRYGAEGVGLFRTEMLYLDRVSMPTEEEQYAVYQAAADLLNGLPMVVRTFDIGGDKPVPYIGNENELNPFLGWRGIRMMDKHQEMFEVQFRALFRASRNADLRIMLPMVANLDELEYAQDVIQKVRRELKAEGIPTAERVQVGIMIEVPSAALMADRFAPHVDFFSIGTNDLAQYTLAADRVNARVSHLADAFHPAVLRLIAETIEAGHAHGKWVGLCGEFAGRPQAVPILLGLGLDEFSMAAISIPTVKATVRSLRQADCKRFAQEVLKMASASEVRAACDQFVAEKAQLGEPK